MRKEELLRGAYDLHIHAAPDVVPRSQDLPDLVRAASQAGMGGILIKDHTTSTVGRCYSMNRISNAKLRLFSCLALNPPVGGLNPSAVESALRCGADLIFFPTYGAANHIAKWGAGKPPTAFPLPGGGYSGISILDGRSDLLPACEVILRLAAQFDAAVGTGHLSAMESMVLLRAAARCGVKRMIVTHASESVTPMPIEQQEEAARLGAFIEHSFFALTESCPGRVSLDFVCRQIREVGVESVILTSDFGQLANAPPVEGFLFYLQEMKKKGFSAQEIGIMVRENPRRLIERRRESAGG